MAKPTKGQIKRSIKINNGEMLHEGMSINLTDYSDGQKLHLLGAGYVVMQNQDGALEPAETAKEVERLEKVVRKTNEKKLHEGRNARKQSAIATDPEVNQRISKLETAVTNANQAKATQDELIEKAQAGDAAALKELGLDALIPQVADGEPESDAEGDPEPSA